MFNICFYMFRNFIIVFFVFLVGFSGASAAEISSRLKGRILLQVESRGEAWYVEPDSGQRFYMGKKDDAFLLMRELGVGISDENLSKIPVNIDSLRGWDTDQDGLPDDIEKALGMNYMNNDSDGDGYFDMDEVRNGYDSKGGGKMIFNEEFMEKSGGKIFLQVEGNGEAWYVNPVNGERYFLGRPSDAYDLMRDIGLGITNKDLGYVELYGDSEFNDLLRSSVENLKEYVSFEYDGEFIGYSIMGKGSNGQELAYDKVRVGIGGGVNLDEDSDSKLELNIEVEGDASGSGSDLTNSIEAKVLKKMAYLKLGGLSEMFDLDLAVIDNKWISFDREEYGINDDDIVKVTENKELRDLHWRSNVFVLDEQLDDEEIDGMMNEKYSFNVSRENLIGYSMRANEIKGKRVLREDVVSQLDKVEVLEMLVWIDKKSGEFRRVYWSANFNDGENKMYATGEFGIKGVRNNVVITPPSESVPFEEIMPIVMDIIAKGAESRLDEARVNSGDIRR